MKMRMKVIVALAAAVLALVRLGWVIAAECTATGNTYWRFATKQAGTRFGQSTNGPLYWTSGTRLSACDLAGSILFERDFLTVTLGRPLLVNQSGGHPKQLVVAGSHGAVYALNSTNGFTNWSRSLRRQFCSGDAISATPVVQLFSASDAAFQATMTNQDDLLIVGTDYRCGTTTQNRVYGDRKSVV